MHHAPRSNLALCLLVALLGLVPAATTAALPTPPRPPEQPAAGPGGRAVAFEGVNATRIGRLPDGAWLFEPTDLRLDGTAAPTPSTVPLVIFLHGFTAVDPAPYRAWIDHLVRRGAIVVYPDYQTLNPFETGFDAFQPNALAGVRAALAELKTTTRIRPDLSRVAVVGHSLGGVLAANYAAIAAQENLPVPTVLLAVEPGGCEGCGEVRRGGTPLADLAAIPASTHALVIVGEDDDIVGERAARRIWADLTTVPLDRRDYVTLPSDHRGFPPLRATHLMPQTAGLGGAEDALDWYGTWKLLDALIACAFADDWCATALGDTPEQRFMGLWSDGEPVTEAGVTDEPGPP